MISTTLSDFRKETKQYLDKVTNERETLIINRGKDTGIVIISLEEYNSLNTTLHEMSSRKNMEVLDASIKQMKESKHFRKKLIQ
ncbi:MAG: type II toxin-antitoxin system Phd/YefM family antitoxin [Sediminibacterium sp.]